ncbi:MAG: tagaturonate epimerase family protein [Anaerolineae bacterium]
MNRQSTLTLNYIPQSLVDVGGATVGLVAIDAGPRLAVLAPDGNPLSAAFEGDTTVYAGQSLLLGPLNAHNAAALRNLLPWLRPQPLGLRTSAGMGDRLGLATPGHVRAVRATGSVVAPIFAQQSIREMTRTGRSPQDVMDDATWGIFQEGWRLGVGADADHLKVPADIDACLAAGFSFFTIDPGEYVDSDAETMSGEALHAAVDELPWDQLEDNLTTLARRYLNQAFEVERYTIRFDTRTLLEAAVKYGRAIAHVAAMYRHLANAAGDQPFELEVSVDETDTPTTHAQHLYIVRELRRLRVRWVSLAPRYVGRFEKGVDYIGDLADFESDFAVHAAIARVYGPYKLSLHSGSDKFRIYPIAARQTHGMVHLKTAGTSYLEALHTVAALDPALFREIYAFARDRYPIDRASYHVSADVSRTPRPEDVADGSLASLLDDFDAREILHVTFGSVLTTRREDGGFLFYDRLMALLRRHPDAYAANLERHFARHLRPFANLASSSA